MSQSPACPKTSLCACPNVKCMVSRKCMGITKCSEKSPKRKSPKRKSRSRKPCKSNQVRNLSTGRCRNKVKSNRRFSKR